MQFSTKIPIPISDFPIDYNSKIISLGSCFAENIGEKFEYFQFQNTVNPFGIIFNPVSLEKLIYRSIQKDYFSEKDIFFHNDLWHCFEVHSELSHSDKMMFLENLNRIIELTNQQISESTHIIITLGTAWIYRNFESKEVVANCHKIPQKQFVKELLSVEEIQRSLENIIDLVSNKNPDVKFIFTISPVRHIKDGFVENQRSKAHLITAIHETINNKPQTINYFPGYEIMMDELRDYRFYAEDMLHPSQVAIDYIWERFKETTILESANKTMEEVNVVQKGLAHRPFNPNSESHLKFLSHLAEKKKRLISQFPFMNF
ncbi:MAG: GSCFA domain-containing protein [Flavobacterium sp.]